VRLDGYIRVSKTNGRDGESFISPEVQCEQIETWARLRGATIIAWHRDFDQTGGKLDRPGLNKIMRRIREGKTDGIAVSRLDRLSRAGVGDALKLVEEIHSHGATIAAVDMGIDPTTPFGEFGMTIMLGLGRMERRRITEGWDVSRARANERGVYRVRAPFGYSRDATRRLRPSEHSIWVRGAFERRARGMTWADIARWLNSEGVPTPGALMGDKTGMRQWVRGTVKDMCSNRAYMGIAYDGEYENPTAHEAIVSRALFEAAKGHSLNPSQIKGEGNMLAGLLRCAGCSYRLAGGKSGSPGERVRHYYCKRHHGSGSCSDPAGIRAHLIEPWVVEQFFAYIENPRFEPSVEAGGFEALRASLDRAEKELEAFVKDTQARDLIGRDLWMQGVRARKDAVTLARREVEDSRARATGVELPPVADLHEWWPTLRVQEQRLLLMQAIDAIMVRATGRGKGNFKPPEERSRILWRGQAPADLPHQGQRDAAIRPFVFAPDFAPVELGVPLAEEV
jgi:site-specific DNA recombinase